MNKSIWVAVFTLLVAALYFIWQSVDMADPVETAAPMEERPVVLEEPVFSNYVDGRRKWRLEAVRAEVMQSKSSALLYETKGTLYAKEEPHQVELVIAADSCAIEGDRKTAEFSGRVRVHFADGKRLHTEQLVLDQKKEAIHSRQFARIDDRESQIDASSFFYDMNLRQLKFERPKMMLHLD